MQSSVSLCLVIILTAALCTGISGAQAGRPSSPLIDHDAVSSLVLRATKKCIVIGGHKFCKDVGHKDKDNKAPPAKSQAPAKTTCPLGTKSDGSCVCPPGQVSFADGTCGKPCGYGMSGKPPNCRCVTGATLQVAGPLTKACLCPDGKPPEQDGDFYRCKDLGPQ